MLKKAGLLSFLLISLSLVFSACAKPYEDLSLSVSDSQIVLYLNSEEQNLDEEYLATYPSSASVTATVSGADKNVSTAVSFVQYGNVVSISNVVKTDNVTTADFTALNPGKSIVYVNTKEGNKRNSISVTVYRVVDSVDFLTTALAVATDSALNLNNYVSFTPSNTNQKEMKFYIDDPDSQAITTDALGNTTETEYAKIVNGVLTIKDMELAPFDYINLYNYVPVAGYSVYNNELVTQTKQVAIVELIQASDINLTSVSDLGDIILTKNIYGQYEIVLGSNLTQSVFAFQRGLNFMIGEDILTDRHYRVSLVTMSTAAKQVLSVTDKTNHNARQTYIPGEALDNYTYNSFEINSIATAGEVVLTFHVDYYGFEGLFTIPVEVKVTVKEFPTTVAVTNAQGQAYSDGQTIDIYNQYGGYGGTSQLGQYLKLSATPEMVGLKYSLFLVNASGLIIKNSVGNIIPQASAIFSNNEAIYLTHSYTDLLPEDAQITFVVTYTMAPGQDQTNYEIYTLEFTLNINFKIGIENINSIPSQMDINVVNSTLITSQGVTSDIVLFPSPNQTLLVNEIVKSIEIISFNDTLVANIDNFNLDPLDNEYYTIEYNLTTNAIEILPNSQGNSARIVIRLTTYNGLMKETLLNLFAPLAYTNNLSPYVQISEINGTKYEETTRGYNLFINQENSVQTRLSKDELGNLYDEDGLTSDQVGSGFVPLATSYYTTSYINVTTSSSLVLNFYNFILSENGGEYSIVPVLYNSHITISGYSTNYFAIETDPLTGEKIIRTKSLATTGAGQSLTINFGGYTTSGVYVVRNFTLLVKITKPLQTIYVSPSTKLLYEESSLGSLNTSQSFVQLSTTSIPSIALTAANNILLTYTLQSSVVYTYGLQLTPSSTYNAEISQTTLDYVRNYINTATVGSLAVSSFANITDGGYLTINFMSNDLVNLTATGFVTAQLQDSFNQKLYIIYKIRNRIDLSLNITAPENAAYFSELSFNPIKTSTINSVFSSDIKVRIYATAIQYSHLPLSAYADITIAYAVKVNNIIVENVDLIDGVYFDVRDSSTSKTISFYTLPANASNGKVTARVVNTSVAKIISGLDANGIVVGNSITIERVGAGTTTIILAAQDSYQLVNGIHVPYLIKEFRVKVADGTQANPFEIRTTEEFLNIANSSYYYVLAKDINLVSVANTALPIVGFTGGLNGIFTYFEDGIYKSVQHTIYGVNINQTITQNSTDGFTNVNIGLFDILNEQVSLQNIKISNASITLTFTNTDQETTPFTELANVGILAGSSAAYIYNPIVNGTINVTTNVENANIGGVVGLQQTYYQTQGGSISSNIVGKAFTTTGSFNNDNLNSSVIIVFTSTHNNTLQTSNKNIGGVVGYLEVSGFSDETPTNDFTLLSLQYETYALQNLVVASKIISQDNLSEYNTANVSCVVSQTNNSVSNNNLVTPILRSYQNVGGLIGYATNSVIKNSVVQMYDSGLTGTDSAAIIATNNVGGLVGVGTDLTILYSYVRSYYNKTIDNINYYGNILLINGETNVENAGEVSAVYVGGLVGALDNGTTLTSLYQITATNAYAEQASQPLDSEIVFERTYYNNILNSYFNAEINASFDELIGDVFVGGLVGGTLQTANAINLQNTYVFGNILTKQVVVDTTDNWQTIQAGEVFGVTTYYSIYQRDLVPTNRVLVTTINKTETRNADTEVRVITDQTIVYQYGVFVGNEVISIVTTDDAGSPITIYTNSYQNRIVGGNVVTSYAYTNESYDNAKFVVVPDVPTDTFESLVQAFELNQQTVQFNSVDYDLYTTQNYNYTYSSVDITTFVNAGFNISDGLTNGDFVWILYDGGGSTTLNNGLPMLVSENSPILLYKVLPSSIDATVLQIPDGVLFNNLKYIKVNDSTLVLFYNNVTSGVATIYNNIYYLAQTGQTIDTGLSSQVIEINLNVDLNAGSVYAPLISGDLVVTSSNPLILNVLSDGRLQTLGTGIATLTIALKLNPLIYTTIDVLIVKGISSVQLHDTSAVYDTQTVIVDKTNIYNIDAYNKYEINGYNTTFAVNTNVGYMVSMTNEDNAEIGVLQVNNVQIQVGNTYVFTNTREFNVTGIDSGVVGLTIVPFIITTYAGFGQTIIGDNATVTNAILVNDLAFDVTFNVIGKASEINTNSLTSVTISPLQTTQITVSLTTGAFVNYESGTTIIDITNYQTIVQDDLVISIYNLLTNQYVSGTDALILYELVSVTSSEITNANDEVLQLKINYTFKIYFDTETYKLNAQTYNLNEQSYKLIFTPQTNEELSADFTINIEPNNITSITSAFYAGNEVTTDSTNQFNPNENSTNYIVPGRVGLLKLYLYPEFNNAEYVEVTIPQEYQNYITFEQMLEVYSAEGYIYNYSETGFSNYLLDGNSGIRLRNLSYLTSDGDKLFNGSFFIKLGLSAYTPTASDITFTITAYRTINGVKTQVATPRTLSLEVQPLPTVSISYLESTSGIMAVGTSITFNVEAFNIDQDPTVYATSENTLATALTVTEGITAGTYVLTVDASAVVGDTITVVALVVRNINGTNEIAQAELTIKLVEFVVNSVYLNGASSATQGTNTLEILNGTSNEISVSVNATYNSATLNGEVLSSITNFENIISGKTLTTNLENNTYLNNWYIQRNTNNIISYEALVVGANNYDNVFMLNAVEINDIVSMHYYAISAYRVTSGTYNLGFIAKYYYDDNGRVQPYLNQAFVTYYEVPVYVFGLIIKDNSTYDHPNPISSVEEFNNMQDGIHYILTSDITLNNHTPQAATFASLDGNGFVININSYNMSGFDGATSATAGIFTTISENTVIKNLTINVGGLLITKNDITSLTETGVDLSGYSAKIDLEGISTVVFGVLAGQNNGTITNI